MQPSDDLSDRQLIRRVARAVLQQFLRQLGEGEVAVTTADATRWATLYERAILTPAEGETTWGEYLNIIGAIQKAVELAAQALNKPQRERRPLPPSLRWQILKRDGFRCQICGRSAPEVTLHVDHKIPVARGGTDDPDNLWTLCAECNLGKGTDLVPTTDEDGKG